MKFFTISIILLSLLTTKVNAQSKGIQDSLYMVKLVDQTSFLGTLKTSTDSTLSFQTQNIGFVTISKMKISEMRLVKKESLHEGQYWFPNPNSTRYFFSPSAFNLKAGEGYYQNNYILLNSFYVGITDFLTIGGGFEITSLFASSSPGPIYFLTLKGGAPIAKNLNLAAGILYGGIPSSFVSHGNYDNFGIGYGIITYGNRNTNLTVGIGKGFENGTVAKRPYITFSGMARVSPKFSFVSENWLIPSTKYEDQITYTGNYNYLYSRKEINTYPLYFSYGARFFGEKLSIDLGFINSSEISRGISIGFPYVAFVVKF